MSQLGGNSREQLARYVERVEAIETEIKERKADLKDLYAEAKGEGFDVAIMKAIVKFRAKGIRGALKERDERHDLLDTYLAALGWLPDGADTPANDDAEAHAP